MNSKSCQHPKLSNTLLKCRNLKSTDGTVNLSLIVLSIKNYMGKYSKETLRFYWKRIDVNFFFR